MDTVLRSSHQQPKHISRNLMSYREKLLASYNEVPRDAHADILLLFLKLDALNDRREAQLLSLLNHLSQENVTQLCHHWWKEARTDKTLRVSQSNTALGKRRPSVFGANLYNQQLALSSDSEDMDT